MKDLFYDLSAENYHYLVNWYQEDGSTWQEAASEQWSQLSERYDFSVPNNEPTEKDVSDALSREEYLLATKLAVNCDEIEPLEFAIEHRSPELLYGLISYFTSHGYYGYYRGVWAYINNSNLLAKCVRYRAEKCFILLLTFDKIDAIQVDMESDTLYRTLDWLLLPKYEAIGIYHKANKQITTYSYYGGELVKMDLFAAFALENKFTLANRLIHNGWKTINPDIGDFDEKLIDAAIYQAQDGKPNLLEWYLSLIGSHLKYSQEIFEVIDNKKEDLSKLIPRFEKLVDLYSLEKEVCTTISKNYPPYEQLETFDKLSALHNDPVRSIDYQPRPKSISIYTDIKRIHESLLSPYITDFRVCLIENSLLSVALFEYGESKPIRRATIDCSHLPSFMRMFELCKSEGTYPTDFQIQLSILSMPEKEIKDNILSKLEFDDIT